MTETPLEICQRDVALFRQNFPQHYDLLMECVDSGDIKIIDKRRLPPAYPKIKVGGC